MISFEEKITLLKKLRRGLASKNDPRVGVVDAIIADYVDEDAVEQKPLAPAPGPMKIAEMAPWFRARLAEGWKEARMAKELGVPIDRVIFALRKLELTQ